MLNENSVRLFLRTISTMKKIFILLTAITFVLMISSCKHQGNGSNQNMDTTKEKLADSAQAQLHFPGEKHLKNVRQLTFGGDNAEAYWSFDGKKIVFQRTDHQQYHCDQIFWGNVDSLLNDTTSQRPFLFHLESTGKGRTTCAAFLPGDSLILYASTHATADTCPPVVDRTKIGKYVWPVYNSYEIYIADLQGHIRKQLTKNNYYDAEATLSPKGDKIIFTSDRDGDLDLYEMNLDGSNVKRITHTLGYDGGAWFSPDGNKIVWRCSRPAQVEEKNEYRRLLKNQLVMPTKLQIWVANADGSDAHQVTELNGANWAPMFTPDGNKILFSSNLNYSKGYPFDLFLVNLDGSGLEQVTFSNTFEAFPMFSHDGKHLIWCGDRNDHGTHDVNIFIADWIP